MKGRMDEELYRLDIETMSLSSLVEEALGIITTKVGNTRSKERIEEIDREVKERSRNLESGCTNILLRFHPVAGDLRRISSTLHAVRDLSRIGDNALDYFEIYGYLSSPDLYEEIGLGKMALEVKNMLFYAVSSFLARDVEKARETVAYDDVIDSLFMDAKKKLVSIIKEGRDGNGEAIDLMIGAKYLERMGDHAASIAQCVVEEAGDIEERNDER
ncbi:MAG: phosphate signaling complex PhoU family protein [Candidatus Ornithospirochaeta sp.]